MNLNNMNETQFCDFKERTRKEIEAKSKWTDKDVVMLLLCYSQTADGQMVHIDVDDTNNLVLPYGPIGSLITDKRANKSITDKLIKLYADVKNGQGFTSVSEVRRYLNFH